MLWVEIEAKKKVVEKRLVERRPERRPVGRTMATRKRVEVVRKPTGEAKDAGIMSRYGSWLLKVLRLRKSRKD
jgi:hypothetical protein